MIEIKYCWKFEDSSTQQLESTYKPPCNNQQLNTYGTHNIVTMTVMVHISSILHNSYLTTGGYNTNILYIFSKAK